MGGEPNLPGPPRVERTQAEIAAFRSDLAAWAARRHDADIEKRHTTQITAVQSFLLGAASVLDGEVAALRKDLASAAPPDPARVYERCLLLDRRIGWLRRLWKFFTDRFDQRDDPALKPLLDAADDVVWSCFHPVMRLAEQRGVVTAVGSPPLPFIELEVSPAATPSTFVPATLERDAGDALKAVLRKLPFSVVHLPAASLRSPWWLVFVAHEVGHCVQAELGLVEPFKKHLRDAVRPHTKDDFEADLWARWSEEIFADYFSALMMGPAALRGLVEFALETPAGMRKLQLSYPRPAVRLALLSALLGELGLDGREALCGIDPAAIVKGDPKAEADLALVPHVVAAVRARLPGLPEAMEGRRTLAALGQFDASDLAPITALPPGAASTFATARQLVIGAVDRWKEIEMRPTEAERDAERRTLAKQMLESIVATHLPGQRPATKLVDATEDGRDLARELLAMPMPEETP